MKHATWVLKSLLSVLDIFNIYSFKMWLWPKHQTSAVSNRLSKNRRFCQKNMKKENIFEGNSPFCQKNENPNSRKVWTKKGKSDQDNFCLTFQRNQTKLLQITFLYNAKFYHNRKRKPSLQHLLLRMILVAFFPLPTILE